MGDLILRSTTSATQPPPSYTRKAGILKDIQEWLGHADFYTTMNIYTHLEKSHREEKAQSLNQILHIPLEPDGVRTAVRTGGNSGKETP
ncbi:MAG: hypothetical protein LUE23_09820 [Lachnospiraceae bacterium]|nr:hypothetical protein [Lachnospiraceae bacterium]